MWETDQTGIKVRERLDIKAIDEEAIVMAEHTIKTTTDVQQTAAQSAAEETKTYTQAEIGKNVTRKYHCIRYQIRVHNDNNRKR